MAVELRPISDFAPAVKLAPLSTQSTESFSPATEAAIPTDPRTITANLLIFVNKVQTIEESVQNYCDWKGIGRTQAMTFQSQERDDEGRAGAEAAFHDLFAGVDLSSFRRDYGEEAEGFIRTKNELEGPHLAYASDVRAKTEAFNSKDRVKAALSALKTVPGLSETQRAELLSLSGYSPDEVITIIKRLGGSIPLYGFLYATSDWASDWLGVLGGVAFPLENNQITDPKTLAATLGSAGVYYVSKFAQATQAERMLKDDRVNRIPNPTSVIGYYLGQKLFPDNERAQTWFTRLSYVVNPLELQQERWWAFAPVNPSIFIAGNVVSTAINTAQLGAMELSRRQEIWSANKAKKAAPTQPGIKQL